jgi:hypothetical protein
MGNYQSKPFRILSLDGGGSWAVIQAMALRDMFGGSAKGRAVLGHFNLVAANSGGSIVLAALTTDITLDDLIAKFRDVNWRKQIFVRRRDSLWGFIKKKIGIGARYYTAKKLEGLTLALNNAMPANPMAGVLLKDLPAAAQTPGTHYLIVGFDYDRSRGSFFRSDYASKASSSNAALDIPLVHAVHASTNAPVNYFDEPTVWQPPTGRVRRYWDGAVTGNNNPVLAAVVEASANGVAREDIRVLSIGTGSEFLPMWDQQGNNPQHWFQQKDDNLKLDTYVRKMATSILDDPPDSASFIAHVALGLATNSPFPTDTSGPCLVRMSPLVQPIHLGSPGQWGLPSYAPRSQATRDYLLRRYKFDTDDAFFAALDATDMDAVEDFEVNVIVDFCNSWLAPGGNVPNQPIRMGTNLGVDIGHRTYAQARQAAVAWALCTSPTGTPPPLVA